MKERRINMNSYAGGGYAVICFVLLLTLTGTISAQEFSPQLEGFFVRGGIVLPESNYKIAPAISGGGSIAFTPSGVATLSAIFWRSVKDYYGWENQSEDDIKYSYLGVNITGLYKIRLSEDAFTTPYLGIGLALNRYSTNYPEGWPDVDKSKISPEPHINAGFEFPNIHPTIKPCVHLKYTLSDVSSFLVLVGANVNVIK